MLWAKIVLGGVTGIVLAGFFLWLAVKANQRRSNQISQKRMHAWFRRRVN